MEECLYYIKYNSAYIIDRENKILQAHDYKIENNRVILSDPGKLLSVNSEIASDIEKYFKIDIKEYGIDIINKEIFINYSELDSIEFEEIPKEIPKKKQKKVKQYDKVVSRLIRIIIQINQNEGPTTKEFAEEFNVTERTIQKDIYERLIYLPIMKKDNRFYLLDDFKWNYT